MSRSNARRISIALGLALAALASTSGAEPSRVVEREISVPKCDKPSAKVMFTEFKCKSADCSAGRGPEEMRQPWWYGWTGDRQVSQPRYTGVGKGLSDMLATALSQTGCFEVMERAELEEIQKELGLVGKKAAVEQADYMITGSITSIGMDQSSTSLAAIPFLAKIPLLGSGSYKSSKVHMNIDLRVVDIAKAKIVASKTFEGNNERNGFGLGAVGLVPGMGVLGGNHASISGSPLEEVARDVLVRSTAFVTESIASRNVTDRVVVKTVEPKTAAKDAASSDDATVRN